MPRFQVHDSFVLEARSLFVLAGSVVEGTVTPGMVVTVPLNSSLAMTGIVHSVEFTRRQGREDVCLCIHCEDQAEMSIWRGLRLENEQLHVSEEAHGGQRAT